MRKHIALCALFLTLISCASSDAKKDKEKIAEPAKPEINTDNLICPQVAILQEAQDIIDYGGEKPDPSQLVARARLKSIDGDCGYRTDNKKDKKSGVDIKFTVHEVAGRGPRLGGNQVSFPYFIAIVDPNETVLSRQIVTTQITFKTSDDVVEQDEKLHVFIPITPDALMAGPSYRVLIGFKQPGH